MEPLDRQVFQAAQLVTTHPPVFWHDHKRLVFTLACPSGSSHRGRIEYTRWSAIPLPDTVDVGRAARLVEMRDGIYDYEPTTVDERAVEWHVNFADPHLFFGYGGRLFAQDEMQVAEHPALASLKEALQAGGREARTVEGGAPTPVLVAGVERRCRVATDRDAAAGRPRGLYGNEFAAATEEAVRRATTPIDPPTITNLIAMAAPSGGQGRYQPKTIEKILVTALTGFRAAVMESHRERGESRSVVVHTGFWGCGAFGGNRRLMAILQVIAAAAADVERLVFHSAGDAGRSLMEDARRSMDEKLGASTVGITDLIERVEAMGFEWGLSDGN